MARVRKEKKERHELQESMRVELEEKASAWEKSIRIRGYLVALENSLGAGKIEPVDPSSFDAWLSWAKWHAEFLDPTVPTPKREEYAPAPVKLAVSELDLTKDTAAVVASLQVNDTDELYAVEKERVTASERGWGAWSEICRVLEGLHYNVSSRGYHY